MCIRDSYNTADSIIVGNFLGSNALAAVGSSGSPIYLLIGFSQGVAVGAGVVVSQYLGAKDKKETHIAVHTSLAIAVILGPVSYTHLFIIQISDILPYCVSLSQSDRSCQALHLHKRPDGCIL